ncbi:hypothetical protein J7T55_010790 [Diaporthe amygdali]|uniref:uncharacterized protein n=1 Tax=Phomopsis amygdali TaxID=1214568 RepID=UPI0022FE21DA|nr:uncharacterized protein J7T55_010790 [Diaporthe amygdali]KAJ0114401.1 hypothetical protein J7T55_010790 [Diaporthe amygdali]
MGSPHMLYVIAKVNGRYRSLAVLYRHYDNKGEWAVETCHRLIGIFEEPANRSLLLHEIQLASKLPPEKWSANPEYRNERPAFPFIATCLMLGASVEPETGKGYNATHEPFNMPLAAFDEGCTILDVTDPAAVRYAFAFILPQRTEPEGIIKTSFGNTPLTAWEYMEFYGEPFLERVYRGGEDDAAIAKTHAYLTDSFRAQAAVDTAVIASSLIDEDTLESAWPYLSDHQSWRRRADLGLPEIVPRPSPVRDPAPSSLPAAHHSESLYKIFEQSYRLFEPGYNEGLDTEIFAPLLPIKQVVNILHFGSLEESSWQARAAEYEPKDGRCFRENGVQYFTFQVDDAPVTPGLTLDVLHGWMVAASTQEEYGGRRHYDYYLDCTNSQSDQNILKFFGLAGPNHRIVKPLPGRALFYAKKSYHCNGDWTTVGLEAIKQGEWTAFLVQQWKQVRQAPDPGMSCLAFKRDVFPVGFHCAFVSRGADGQIMVADPETFRSVSCSKPAYEALRALDPSEETYGRGLVDILKKGDGAINGIPASLMRRDEVLELLSAMDVIKTREEERLTNSWSNVHRGLKERRAREREAKTT